MAKNKLGSRFSLARDTHALRMVATLEGEVGTGKTHFALTGPSPIFVANIDAGMEGVVEQFRKEGKEIYDEKYVWIPGDPNEVEDEKEQKDLQDLAKEIRDQFEKDITYAMNNGARTLVVDTESRFWQVYRYAEFGSPNGDNPRDFDALNQRFESFIHRAKATDVNLFLIRSMKDKWGAYGPPNKSTGKKSFAKGGREVWGYEHLPGMVYHELTFFRMDEKDPDFDAEFPYQIKFGKMRGNTELQFTTTPRCSFAEVGTLIYPETSVEDWEQ